MQFTNQNNQYSGFRNRNIVVPNKDRQILPPEQSPIKRNFPIMERGATQPEQQSPPIRKPLDLMSRTGDPMKGLDSATPAKTDQGSWAERPFMGSMDTGTFVKMAGGLGQAIAPDTAMGRVGGFMAGMADTEQGRLDALSERQDKIAKEQRGYEHAEELEKTRADRTTKGWEITAEANKRRDQAAERRHQETMDRESKRWEAGKESREADTDYKKAQASRLKALTNNLGKTEAKDLKQLPFKDQTALHENIMDSTLTGLGFSEDEVTGEILDQDGNPVSPEQMSAVQKRTQQQTSRILGALNEPGIDGNVYKAMEAVDHLDRLQAQRERNIREARNMTLKSSREDRSALTTDKDYYPINR